MNKSYKTKLILVVLSSVSVLLIILYAIYCHFRQRFSSKKRKDNNLEDGNGGSSDEEDEKTTAEELMKFSGGENLRAKDILNAPGEVVGKSSYGTVYKAIIHGSKSMMLLRFVRPACVRKDEDVMAAVKLLGIVRHPNLVPLRAMYLGPKGERLFVYPFYAAGTLSQFLPAAATESYRWDVIYKLCYGIAKGLDYLHTGFDKPIIHGNLKSSNVLLDVDCQPRLSDFGLHRILNPAAAQEMLEVSAAQGYKAPELIKMKDVCKETDIFSLGVVMLEMLTRKNPVIKFSPSTRSPVSVRNTVIEHKVSDFFNAELINSSTSEKSGNEESLLMLLQLAMTCCSSSPSLRPDIKHVVRMLEEISRGRM